MYNVHANDDIYRNVDFLISWFVILKCVLLRNSVHFCFLLKMIFDDIIWFWLSLVYFISCCWQHVTYIAPLWKQRKGKVTKVIRTKCITLRRTPRQQKHGTSIAICPGVVASISIYGKPKSIKISDFNTRNTGITIHVHVFHACFTHKIRMNFRCMNYTYFTCILHVKYMLISQVFWAHQPLTFDDAAMCTTDTTRETSRGHINSKTDKWLPLVWH